MTASFGLGRDVMAGAQIVANEGVSARIIGLWTVGGIIVSIIGAIITSTLYVSDLLRKIDRLEQQVSAINKALSFGNTGEVRGVVFNGPTASTPCPENSVLREVRISYQNITSSPQGEIRCVSLKPAEVP